MENTLEFNGKTFVAKKANNISCQGCCFFEQYYESCPVVPCSEHTNYNEEVKKPKFPIVGYIIWKEKI